MTRQPPPEETRFRKGTSGNPGGRPPKRQAKPVPSAFDILVGKTFSVQVHNQTEEVGIEEALQRKTYSQAIAGNSRARRLVLKMIMERELAMQRRRSTPPKKIDFTYDIENPTNAIEAMLLLGICGLRSKRA